MHINLLFPTPVLIFDINRDITEQELAFINSQPTRSNIGNTTSTDSYILKNIELIDFYNFFKDCLKQYLETIYNSTSDINLRITQSWINYTQPGGFHHKHQHANSFISGVFYIQTNEETDRIYFFKNQYEQLKLAINEWTYYNTESWWFSSIKGQLLLFPSSLTHSVENTSVDSSTRISISFNTFPVGILGIKEELTELCL